MFHIKKGKGVASFVENLSTYIDHTLLKADATRKQILQLCQEAKTYHFASVCVNPYWVATCKEALKDSEVKICTVVGFPLGATTSEVKAFEARQAIANGADEIDMVANLSYIQSGNQEALIQDIHAVVEAVGESGIVKVIIETCLLTNKEKSLATQAVIKAGAHFVKTSTGFSISGATVEDIEQIKQVARNQIGIKAAGGIRTKKEAEKMIAAGATRLGTSGGVAIVHNDTSLSGY